MTPPPAPPAQLAVASPAPGASPAPTTETTPSPTARPTRTPVPTPSLKAGETITWVKLERPRFAIGEIIISSFTIVGIVFLIALVAGLILGHVRSKRPKAHGSAGLGLR